MVAGLDRYFQIARCFRDEDLRADRQPEFTQVDLEMSFVDQDQLIEIVEGWIARLFEVLLGKTLPRPFPRMSYAEAIDAYGVDNPDTRYGLKMQDLTETVRGSEFQVFHQVIEKGGIVKALRFPDGARLSRRELDNLDGMAKDWGAGGLIWAKCTADGIQSPISKFLSEEIVNATVGRMAAKEGDLLLMMAGAPEEVNPWMGRLRAELAEAYDMIDPSEHAFTWILEFPLFERDKEGGITSMHHPFTAPQEEDLPLLDKDPEACRSLAYDLVLNGTEIGGGSIRNHQADTQKKILSILGISEAEAEEKFGFLLDALSYGAPPHGGIAFGLDRLVMILAGAKSLREVIAFPKTQKASCLLTQSPGPVDAEQLRELHVRTVLPRKPASD
jgi:aspartyl-tRNA synthetase